MKRVFYSFGGDEALPAPPTPLTINDDSGDWLVGAMRGFVGVAIAASLASSALAAQVTVNANNQLDEWVPQPSFTGAEDYQLSSLPQSLARAPLAFIADEDFVPPAATAFLDDDGTWQVTILRSQPPARGFIVDDEYSPTLTIEESDPPFIVPAPQRPVAVPLVQEDDLPVVASLAIDETDAPLVFLGARQTRAVQPLTDDDVLPSQVLRLDEFDAPVIAVLPPARPPFALAPDEEYAPTLLVVEADQPVTASPSSQRWIQPYASDDELPILSIDEADAPSASVRPQLRAPALLIADDEYAAPISPLVAEDDGWQSPFQPRPSCINVASILASANTDDDWVPPPARITALGPVTLIDATPVVSLIDATPHVTLIDTTPVLALIDVTPVVSLIDTTPIVTPIDATPVVTLET